MITFKIFREAMILSALLGFTTNINSYPVMSTSKNATLQLYQMMKDIDELFCNSNIHYWAIAGTLLGAIRHGGMIPWDHEKDIDIGIEKTQEKQFLALKKSLEKLGYEVSTIFFGYKIFPKDGRLISKRNFKYPFIDVFVFTRGKAKTKLTYRWNKKRNYFLYSELFPLHRKPFGEFFINCPNNPIPYLDAWYGNWQKEGWIYNSLSKEFEPFILTEKDMIPALPTGPLENRILQCQ